MESGFFYIRVTGRVKQRYGVGRAICNKCIFYEREEVNMAKNTKWTGGEEVEIPSL